LEGSREVGKTGREANERKGEAVKERASPNIRFQFAHGKKKRERKFQRGQNTGRGSWPPKNHKKVGGGGRRN